MRRAMDPSAAPCRQSRFPADGGAGDACRPVRTVRVGRALRAALVTLFLGVALPLGVALAVPSAGATDLSVGFIGDLTGVGANVAQDQLDGFRLGLKHLAGRLGGNEVNLIVAEGGHDPRVARLSVERMVQAERVQVILLSVDAPSMPAMLPPAIAARSVTIALSPPPVALAARDCSAWFFSLSGLAETGHDLTGQYLQQHGFHTVVVAGPDTAAAKAAVAAVQRGFRGQVSVVTSRRGEMNFERDLKSVRAAHPDAVYLLHTGGMAVNFIRQMASFFGKDHPALFGPATTLDQSVLAASGTPAADAWSLAPWSDDVDQPVSRRVMTDFEADYGRPASLAAIIGYDGAMLLDAAVRIADKRFNEPDALKSALRKAEFPSPRGTVRFDTNQFPIQSYLARQAGVDSRGRIINEQRGVFLKDVRDGHAGECPLRWQPEPPPKG